VTDEETDGEAPDLEDEASADEGGEAPAEPEEPGPEDIETQEHDLRKLTERAAKERRRHVVGELTVKRPKQAEVRLKLDRDATTIGRDSGCDIVVDEPNVSRRHARVVHTDAGYFELVDLSSTNGTVTDAGTVERMLLLDGDSFEVGATRFVLHTSHAGEG
jgi:hypothetical protein